MTLQWDVFCRVVDNFGDVGVGWRLAADLAARGQQVRFWLDDQRALAWMAPDGSPGVSMRRWADADASGAVLPGDVVVEAFGCGLPAPFAALMGAQPRPPLWINLEYLSAEAFVGRNHGLPSPRTDGPGVGLTQWFFYPGFTDATGGLLRELDLAERQRHFSRVEWLRCVVGRAAAPRADSLRGAALQADPLRDAASHDDPLRRNALWGDLLHRDARIVSLFCYENSALPQLLDALAAEPTVLLATAGSAARQVANELGLTLARGALRAVLLPHLSQLDYDHLLWASDLNFVRGEDSFVRAQWAGAPFVWQIYPQHDRAHAAKLDAFLARFVHSAPLGLQSQLRHLYAAWNGLAESPKEPQRLKLPDLADWRSHCMAWRAGLWIQADLGTRLLAFAAAKMLK